MSAPQQILPSAAHQVFNLPELAEMIFLQLSTTDIAANVQRTCRRWKAVTAGSSRMQAMLFNKSITGITLYWSPTAQMWTDLFSTSIGPRQAYYDDGEGSGDRYASFEDLFVADKRCWKRRVILHPFVSRFCGFSQDALRLANQSPLLMTQYITQPPIGQVTVRWPFCEPKVVRGTGLGVRWSDVITAVETAEWSVALTCFDRSTVSQYETAQYDLILKKLCFEHLEKWPTTSASSYKPFKKAKELEYADA